MVFGYQTVSLYLAGKEAVLKCQAMNRAFSVHVGLTVLELASLEKKKKEMMIFDFFLNLSFLELS